MHPPGSCQGVFGQTLKHAIDVGCRTILRLCAGKGSEEKCTTLRAVHGSEIQQGFTSLILTDTEPRDWQSVAEFNDMAAPVNDERQSKIFVELELRSKIIKFHWDTGARYAMA